MSQSPSEAAPDSGAFDDAQAEYTAAWGAINRLMREGLSWSGHERNVLLMNRGAERFVDGSAWSGIDWDDDARALVQLDWDFDGDLDLVLTNRTGPRLRIVENRLDRTWRAQDAQDRDAARSRFVTLRPRGLRSNPDAIGARVRVRLTGTEGTRELLAARRAGEGFLSQGSAWLTFGLAGEELTGVVVEWPGGPSEAFTGVSANGFFDLVEGSGTARRFTPPMTLGERGLAGLETPAVAEPESAGGSSRVVLGTPVAMPTLRLERSDGEPGMLFGIQASGRGSGTGLPIALHLYASWCAPCVEELTASEGLHEAWEERGVLRIALAADREGEGDRQAAAALLERVGWSGFSGYATAEALGVLDALHGALLDTELRLPLPATFLIDGEGRLVALYRGAVDIQTLFDDLALTELDAAPGPAPGTGAGAAAEASDTARAARLQRAAPLPGRWRDPPTTPDWAYLESFALKRGLPLAAREYNIAQYEVLPTTAAEVHYRIGRMHAEQGDLVAAIAGFEASVLADPYWFAGWRDLAQALHLESRFRQAVVAYDRALELAPNHVDTLFDRALALAALGDREGADAGIDALAELDPERARSLAERIDAYLREREDGAASDSDRGAREELAPDPGSGEQR